MQLVKLLIELNANELLGRKKVLSGVWFHIYAGCFDQSQCVIPMTEKNYIIIIISLLIIEPLNKISVCNIAYNDTNAKMSFNYLYVLSVSLFLYTDVCFYILQ